MNSKYQITICLRRVPVQALLLVALLHAGGCADLGMPLPPPQQPAAIEPPPPVAVKVADALPPLDVVMVAQQRQCEAQASSVAVADEAKQLRELMQWLKRSCAISDALVAPQMTSLKQLRQRYTWPDAYAAWLDEWRRNLVRMQMLQQRAATAEREQATMVQRLRTIEGDLTTRP